MTTGGSSLRDLPYPRRNGFVISTPTVLSRETLLDRYGRPTGQFEPQPAASIWARGKPPGSEDLPYKCVVANR